MTVLADRQRGRLPARAVQPAAWVRYAVLAAVALAAAHIALVAGHYVVGSFDDDGHYLALAKAFIHGKGYVDTSVPGSPVETLYPPGYPLLIAPLVWLFGGAVWPLRVLSALAFLGCFPLLDRLLRGHSVPDGVRVATLVVFALNPTMATFGSEVMPETVFLLVLLAVLLALPRWERESRVLSWTGVVVAAGTPYLFLLKAAGLPMLAGVFLWLLLRRRWRHLVALAVASAVMLAPLVLVRMASGPVVGSRYTDAYGLAGPLPHAVWSGIRLYVTYAIPATLVPTGGAGLHGHSVVFDVLLWLLRYSAAALVLVGWISWLRRRLDVSVLIVPLYLAETVPFPYINQRRLILLLPLVVAWYVLGWDRVIVACRRWSRGRMRGPMRHAVRYAAVVPVVLVVPVLVWQLPRHYLLQRGESTPAARGSGYVAALRELTPPGWSIAAGYRWTISDLTGRTATNVAHFTTACPDGQPADLQKLHNTLTDEHAATLLDAWVKWPNTIDSTCLLDAMTAAPWAVPAYHGSDQSTVFVLLGPGTPRANLHVALDLPTASASETSLPSGTVVRELSFVAAGAPPRIQLRVGSDRWLTVQTTTTSVAPHLVHAVLPRGVAADAVRFAARGPGVGVRDLLVLAEPA